MLLRVDARDRDWLGGRGPKPTRVGAVDNATGEIVWAYFREQEDSAGYLELLREPAPPRGVALIP